MSVMPQTITNSLADKVSALMRRVEPASSFEVRRLWIEAEKLASVAPADASVLKAFIASFEWDAEKMRYWCANALALDNSANTKVNVSACYRMIGDLEAAMKLAEAAAADANGDLSVLDAACEALFATGFVSKAIEYGKPHAGSSDTLNGRINNAINVIGELESLGITEKQLQNQVQIAAEVAFEQKILLSDVEMQKYDFFDGDSQFNWEMRFPGDIHKELDLEAALASRFVDIPEWDPLQLNVQFKYFADEYELSS